MEILKTEGLKKYYGNINQKGPEKAPLVKALDGVDLSVENGEFVAVVGTSGSGKSTLLHMMGGLDRPTEGRVEVAGKDIFSLTDDELTIFRRRKIGFIFQSYNLVPVLNVYENIALPVELDGQKPDGEYMDRIIKTLGLEEKIHNLPNQLSGGQQQRVAIARALLSKPAIILADEPTGGVKLVVQHNHKKIMWMFFSWSTRISLTIDRHNSRFSGMEKESYRLSKSIFKKSRKYDKSLTGRESSALIFSSCKSNFSLSSLNSFIVMRSLRNRSFNFCNLFSTLRRFASARMAGRFATSYSAIYFSSSGRMRSSIIASRVDSMTIFRFGQRCRFTPCLHR